MSASAALKYSEIFSYWFLSISVFKWWNIYPSFLSLSYFSLSPSLLLKIRKNFRRIIWTVNYFQSVQTEIRTLISLHNHKQIFTLYTWTRTRMLSLNLKNLHFFLKLSKVTSWTRWIISMIPNGSFWNITLSLKMHYLVLFFLLRNEVLFFSWNLSTFPYLHCITYSYLMLYFLWVFLYSLILFFFNLGIVFCFFLSTTIF